MTFIGRLGNFGAGTVAAKLIGRNGVGRPNVATPTLFRHLPKTHRSFRPVRATKSPERPQAGPHDRPGQLASVIVSMARPVPRSYKFNNLASQIVMLRRCAKPKAVARNQNWLFSGFRLMV